MSRKKDKQHIAVIDVGTTKICVLIAHYYADDVIDVLGVGVVPSQGLKKGVVVDIGKTVRSIKQAIKEAELMAGMSIDEVYVGISGAHIASCNSSGVVPIKYNEVSQDDVINVLQAARAVPLKEGQKIIHVVPQYFVVDNDMQISDPRGMHGTRLEVYAHVVTGALSSVENLVSCCIQAGVRVKDLVLEHLASSAAVLTEDEKEFGVGLLDIGGGTADLAIYRNKGLSFTHVIPVAGNHFTNDLAIGLLTSAEQAEKIKKEHGVVHKDFVRAVLAEINDDQHEQRVADHQMIYDILHPRAQELLRIVAQTIDEHNMHQQLVTGLVITGGGALLQGLDRCASELCNVPVRIGRPIISVGSIKTLQTPKHATGYGMIRYVGKELKEQNYSNEGPWQQRILRRMKSWMVDFFN